MKYTTSSRPAAYSIIVAIIMTGFLLVLTTSTLNLVMQEMQDGKGKQDYLKAYAAAEGALEVALFQIKEEGYGYYEVISDLNILGISNKDAKISYQFDGRVSSYTGVLSPYATDIIPLFWIDSQSQFSFVEDLILNGSVEINWNIVGSKGGISGVGGFTPTTTTGEKKLVEIGGNQDFSFVDTTKIKEFLTSNTGSYLITYNPSSITQNYTVETGSGFFTKPRSNIQSSARVGKYTQNLQTLVDNTEFLGILKYSIYSGD